jgi:hypothetical protein
MYAIILLFNKDEAEGKKSQKDLKEESNACL